MKNRIEMKEYYTWAGQALIAVNPFGDILKKVIVIHHNFKINIFIFVCFRIAI